MITRHGIREVFICGALAAAATAGIYFLAQRHGAGWWALEILPLEFFGWVLWFFRDPQRIAPSGPDLFISPADGMVADITPLGPEGKLGQPGVEIGVFMNVFSVHVNRMPCSAVIEEIKHMPGTFMDVRDPQSYEKNESTTLTLSYNHKGRTYPVMVRQIAGLVARRIVTAVKPNQRLERGERLGMIKFGSRVELYLPQELAGEICVTIGQKVTAGLTILAKVKNDD